MWIQRVFAALTLVACALMFLRLLLGQRRRARLDARLRGLSRVVSQRAHTLLRWRSSRREAAKVANEAIRRARATGAWDGNVYTPREMRKPPRDKMH